MNKRLHLIFTSVAVLLTIGLGSCASMIKDWVGRNCNKQEAYAHGMNESRAHHPMNISLYNEYCAPEQKEEIMASYRSGYNDGLKAAPTTIIVQAPRPHARCRTDFFGTPFEADGDNEGAAREHTREKFLAEVCTRGDTGNTARGIFSNCTDINAMNGFFNTKTHCFPQ